MQQEPYIREKAGSLPIIADTLKEILTVLNEMNEKLNNIKEGI